MKRQTPFANNIMSLIHCTSFAASSDKAPHVVSLSELPAVRLESDMVNTKLVKLSMPSIQEARNRAIVLALLTSNTR